MSKQLKHLYEFGAFRLDPAERLLWCMDEVVPLTPKAFETLVVLVENGGHVLGKDELLKTVWADTFVEESTLTSNISTLRKALRQNDENQFIETVPKRGYRFVAEVRQLACETNDLVVHKRTTSRITIKEEISAQTTIATDELLPSVALKPRNSLRTLFGLKARYAVLLIALLLLAITITAFVRESKRRAAVAAREEAQAAYLEGRAFWNQRTLDGLFKSLSCFERAIQKDPNFALGYAGLADAYVFDYEYWQKAEAMAQKALQLDNTLAEPHATLGFIRMFWQWQWAAAEEEFKRAIELNPNYATAHHWYALWLAAHTRFNWAKLEMRKALELDPSSLPINADSGQIYFIARDYDLAIAACRKALAMNPDYSNAHLYLYQVYTQKGMYDEAVEEYFTYQKLIGNKWYSTPANEDMLRNAYANAGIRGFWQANLESLLKRDEYKAHASEKAEFCALLGDAEQAAFWMEKAYEWRNFDFIFMVVNPAFENLNNQRLWDLYKRFNPALYFTYPTG